MAENSNKSSFSMNKGECSKMKKKLLNPNDFKTLDKTENSKLNQLFYKMKLNEEGNVEKMEFSEIKEICKLSKIETKDKELCTAGKIISFLEKISVVLVQPSQEGGALLNIGTNLFLSDQENWILLGQIGEIFGNVRDPLYAVSLTPPGNNLFKVEDKVYFLPHHPSTSLFHVEPNSYNKYNVVYHN